MMKTLWRKGAVALIGLFALIGMIMTGEALADIIIDNGAPGTSFTGSWPVSGGTQPYGANSVWSRNGTTFTWTMTGEPVGTYDVHMWWSGWSSRASSVPVAINHAGGTAQLTINQRLNAGQWNRLGTYVFNGNGSVTITAANGDTREPSVQQSGLRAMIILECAATAAR